MRRIFLLIFFLVIARGADIATTWYFTPDLRLEGNFLVKLFHMGWFEMIAMNFVALIIISAGLIYWHLKPPRIPYNPDVKDAWDFASFAYFGDVMPHKRFLVNFLIKFPKNWRHCCYLCFSSITIMLIVGGIYTVISWFLLRYYKWPLFIQFYHFAYPLSGVILPILLITFYAITLFYRKEYQRYKQENRVGS